jgi:hypothetical protein
MNVRIAGLARNRSSSGFIQTWWTVSFFLGRGQWQTPKKKAAKNRREVMKTVTKTVSEAGIVNSLFFTILLALIICLAAHADCIATTVVLQWDPEADPNLAGYKVYYKADTSSLPFTGTGATEGAAPIDAHGQTSATISGLDPGHAYYFAVTAYNTSGVESSYSNIVSVPEMAPPTVNLSFPANGSMVSGTVSVSGTASDNVGVSRVEFYVNGALHATDTSTPYLYSWNTTSLTGGSYTLQAKAYDAAGNVGQSSLVTVQVMNDTTAPTVAISAPAASVTVSGTATVAMTASDNVAVSKVEFYVNGVLQTATNIAPYFYSWNTSALANGSYTLSAKAYDAAGNVGQSSNVVVTVSNDTTAPAVSIGTPANNATVSGTVHVGATASDNVGVSKVEFYLNGTLKATVSVSPYTYTWDTTALANGTYTLTAKAYDASGNVRQSTAVAVTVNNDTTAPTVSIGTPANNATVSGVIPVSATASDNVAVSKVEFFVNGVLGYTVAASPYLYNWDTSTLVNGTYNFTARAYDAAGNVGLASQVTVTVNNPLPTVTPPTTDTGTPGQTTIVVNASGKNGVKKVELYKNGILLGTATQALSVSSVEKLVPYTFVWNTSTEQTGTYMISAKAYDAAGNVGQSASVAVTVDNSALPPLPNGDVNGDGKIDIADALLALRISVGTTNVTNDYLARADVAPLVNGLPTSNGRVDIADASLILQKAVGKITW